MKSLTLPLSLQDLLVWHSEQLRETTPQMREVQPCLQEKELLYDHSCVDIIYEIPFSHVPAPDMILGTSCNAEKLF